jgi:two-component system, NarL family, sensor kinase
MEADSAAVQALSARIDELMRQHAALLTRLQQDQHRTRHLARSVWRIEEEARRRIARELHDGVGQNLVALMRQLDMVATQLPETGAPRDGLRRARELVQTTLDDTRSLSRLLRPQILDDLGLEAALRWLARSVEGMKVELDLPAELPPLDDEVSTLLFRVAQEALSNASRHAGASRVVIGIRPGAHSLRMDIRDDGRGCDLSAALAAGRESQGSGLGGMRDRIDVFDGKLDLQSVPGKGFNICIELPLRNTARNEP